MELNNEIINELLKNGINPKGLSENEKKYLTQINSLFYDYKIKIEELLKELSRFKFTKSSISEQIECSRQTLYMNPTLFKFAEICEEKIKMINNRINQSDVVSKKKYDRLRNENSSLLSNIVDNALKDVELERLINENRELRKRIEKLIQRFEESTIEVNELKKKRKN